MLIRPLAAIATMACLTLLLAPASWAQDDAQPGRDRGRPGGGRSGGGPGGPGGPPGGGMFGGGGMTSSPDAMMLGLLRADTVRAELEITPDQEQLLQKIADGQRGSGPDFDFRSASDEDRQKFFEKMRADIAKRTAEAKEQVLEVLSPAQFGRLEELVVQAQGVMGLTTPDTSKALGLSSTQIEKLKSEADAVGETHRNQLSEAFRSGDRDAAREKMQAMRKELDSKLLDVLTAEQKAEFEKLKGKPFELPDMSQGGRGFGGPGGPGGPGGRGPGGDRDRGRGPGGDRGRPQAE